MKIAPHLGIKRRVVGSIFVMACYVVILVIGLAILPFCMIETFIKMIRSEEEYEKQRRDFQSACNSVTKK